MPTPKVTRRPTPWKPLVACIVLLFATGCGGESGPSRQPVVGSVTLDGKPLPSGTITFLPSDQGPAASAELSEGGYRIDRDAGPAPGHYTVEIVAVQPTGRRIRHPDLPSETTEEVRNVIPQQYNARTQLQVDVKPDAENRFDFELSSRQEPSARRRRR